MTPTTIQYSLRASLHNNDLMMSDYSVFRSPSFMRTESSIDLQRGNGIELSKAFGSYARQYQGYFPNSVKSNVSLHFFETLPPLRSSISEEELPLHKRPHISTCSIDLCPSREEAAIETPPPSSPNNNDSLESPNKFLCRWGSCSAAFSTRTGLSTHCSIHLEDLRKQSEEVVYGRKRKIIFVCHWGRCGEVFFAMKPLARHLAESDHIGQLPFLKRNGSLSKNVKMYFCSHPGCGKSFNDSSNRKKHERIHDKNRQRYHCTERGCSKSYTKRADLRVHERLHRGELTYECTHPLCDQAFLRLSELQQHEVFIFALQLTTRDFTTTSRRMFALTAVNTLANYQSLKSMRVFINKLQFTSHYQRTKRRGRINL